MSFTVVRYRPLDDRADENQELVEAVFAELAETKPAGLRYMTFRLDDGTFVHVADVEGDNPLGANSAFQAFTTDIDARCGEGEGPNPQAATIVGAYGFEV